MARIGGIISGLDTDNILSQLKSIALQSVTKLQARKDELTSRASAWTAMAAKFNDMLNASRNLAQKFAVRPTMATTSDSSLLGVQVTGKAEIGSHVVRVLQMARSQTSMTAGHAATDSVWAGAGTLSLKIGNGSADHDLSGSTLLTALNDGAGVALGVVRLTDRSGDSVEVDLTGALTLQDVIDEISGEPGVDLTATINADGTGLEVQDNTGSANGPLKIEDVSGTAAADLKIGTGPSGVLAKTVVGTDLDPRYTVALSPGANTLADVRDAVNKLGAPVSASFINTGDPSAPVRLAILGAQSGAVGTVALSFTSAAVTDELLATGDGSRGATLGDYALPTPLAAAGSLTLLTVGGTAYDVRAAGARTGVGHEVEVEASTGKLQFFEDGAATDVTGEIRASYTSAAPTFITAQTAQDAEVEVGTTNPLLFRSATNVLDKVIPGLTMNLLGADVNKTAQITVQPNINEAGRAVTAFIDAYNALGAAVRAQNAYNADTQQKGGALFGESALLNAYNDITRAITADVPGLPSSASSLFQMGVKSATKGDLAVDSGVLQEWLTNRFSDVQAILTRTANAALGSTVSASTTAAGFSAGGVADGSTTDAGWRDDTASTFPDDVTLDFGSARSLTSVVIHTLDDADHPAASWGIKDYDILGLRLGGNPAVAADWRTLVSARGNAQGRISHAVNVVTQQLRVKVSAVNAADGLSRLLEVEAKQTSGAAALAAEVLSRMTDGTTGTFAAAQKSLADEQTRLDKQIEAANERVDKEMARLQIQFDAMEQALSRLQSTSKAFDAFFSNSTSDTES